MNQGKSSRKLGLGGPVLVAVGALMLPALASGATLLLDFGNGDAYDGINSPAHVEGTVSLSTTAWQKVTSSAGGATVKDSDDNDVQVYLGRGYGPNDVFNLTRPVSTVSETGAGIFSTDLTNDALISINDGVNKRDPIGTLIVGLPTGQYYVYVVGHYGGNADAAFNVLAGASSVFEPEATNSVSAVGNVYDLGFEQALAGNESDEWVFGVNYAKFTIDLTSLNPNLIVATDKAQGSSDNAWLTAVMITPVPEPGAVGLLVGAGLLALRRRRGIR